MENIVCKSCGGSVTRQGNYYVCDFCRSKWMIDSGNDVHAVERANAWEALRNNDFEKAAELFENIIVKDASNHEAFWGRALALNGIVYVTDYNENKKVPTCNNITEESFLKNKDVQKAISLAPIDIKESYQKQAEQIEKIRIEWLNKASKEPAYDIFISFKDSDREHGIERTQDSIDVQDLYTALVQKGYNVFFSRVTLRDKVSEQYEPYIYNALKTAKVMIVFGEKAEYFNAVWVKNEWSRFKTRVEKGEKHKNSLITVYKGVNPYEIPVALTGGRQAIDYSIPSNYEVLMNHIKRVIDESEQAVHLDRIQIKGGQMAKKSSKIKTETLQTRELGKGAIAKTSISEKQTLDLAHSYLMGKQWEDSNKLLDDLLFNNPNLADAIWYKLQAKFQVTSDAELFKKISSFSQEDYDTIVRVLNCAEKELATYILNSMYALCKNVSEKTNLIILNTVLPFNYEERANKITQAFADSIASQNFTIFKLLLSTLDSNDVDTYIKRNLEFAKATRNVEAREECLNNVISVDEGNKEAQKMCLNLYLGRDDVKNAIKTLETILQYSSNHKKVVYDLLVQIKDSLNSNEDCLVLREVIKYYPGELIEIKDLLLDVAFIMIRQGHFEHAKYLLSLILTVDENNPKIYWGLCLVKTKSRSDSEISKSNSLLKQVPEYTKYLTMVDENRRQECFKIAKKQENAEASRKKAKKFGIFSGIAVAVVAIIVAIVMVVQFDYTLTYNLDGGSAVNPKEYSIDDGTFSLANPTKTGYTFVGWTSEEISTPTKTVTIKKGSIGNKEFTAHWSANTYNVTYDANGSTASKTTENIVFNTNISLPTVIEKDHYTFGGWYYGNQKVEDGAWKIDGNVTIVARWIPIPYSIIYNIDNGQTTNPATYTIEDNIVLFAPTRDGYTFTGWTGTDLTAQTMNVVIPVGEFGAREYTAHWTPTAYTISYELGGGGIANNPTTYTIEQTLTLSAPTRDGYTFIGWTGTDLTDTTMSVTIPLGCFGRRTYTANWIQWTSVSDFDYLQQNDEISITSYNGSSSAVIIPEKINGKNVTTIAESAFSNKSSLKEIVLPSTLTTIGANAFNNCRFTKIEIPSSVRKIGTSAFNGCNSLTGVYISDVDSWCQIEFTDGYANPLNFSKNLYLNNELVTDLVIPNSVTVIGFAQFYNCDSIKSIEIPDSVQIIDHYAFRYCDGLEEVIIPNSVLGIGQYVFSQCSKLTSVKIGDGLVLISAHAFYDSPIVSLILGKNIAIIETSAFEDCSLKGTIEFPSTLATIGEDAFNSNRSLTKVVIPLSVTSIGSAAFWSCSQLKIYCEAISKPSSWDSSWNLSDCPVYWGYNNVTSNSEYDYVVKNSTAVLSNYKGTATNVNIPSTIDGYSVSDFGLIFSGNKSITSITIPNSVTSINSKAFYNCSKLANVTIGTSVKFIGDSAFEECVALTSINIPNSVTSIGNRAFYSCDILSAVTIGQNVKTIGSEAFYFCQKISDITIPDSTTKIGASAFYYCDGLTQLKLGANVDTIGAKAFMHCSKLASINIPMSVKTIENRAFEDCNKLTIYCEALSQPSGWVSGWNYNNRPVNWGYNCVTTNSTYDYAVRDSKATLIKYKGTATNVNIPTMIDGYQVNDFGETFRGNTSIVSIVIPDSVLAISPSAFANCSALTTVTIGNSVETIGKSAFSGCKKLVSLTIGNKVSTIGDGAFSDCSNLTNIYINDIAMWCNLQYEDYSDTLLDSDTTLFLQNAKIVNLVIPEGVTDISYEAFYYCDTIRSISFPNSLETIGNRAFYKCTSLVSLVIPDNVVSIGYNAFYECNSLTSVVLGNSITSIGAEAFKKSISSDDIASVYIPASVTTIGHMAFVDFDTIYCAAYSQPSGWDEQWAGFHSSQYKTIYWGCSQ